MNFKYPPSQITKCWNQDVLVTLKLLLTQMDKRQLSDIMSSLNGSELDENAGPALKMSEK